MGYALIIGLRVTEQLGQMSEFDHDLLLLEMLTLGTNPDKGRELARDGDLVSRALGLGNVGLIFYTVDHTLKQVDVVEVVWMTG